jgi:hypothetical protein
MAFSGINSEVDLFEILELKNHLWFVGVQFHSKHQRTQTLFPDFIAVRLTIWRETATFSAIRREVMIVIGGQQHTFGKGDKCLPLVYGNAIAFYSFETFGRPTIF